MKFDGSDAVPFQRKRRKNTFRQTLGTSGTYIIKHCGSLFYLKEEN